MKSLFFLLIIILASNLAYGQNTRDVAPTRVPAMHYQTKRKEEKHFLFFGKEREKSEVEAFRERISEVYEEKKKEQKLAEKPQFSDPLYFGHKRPPKKRPMGKRKFCKECGLTH